VEHARLHRALEGHAEAGREQTPSAVILENNWAVALSSIQPKRALEVYELTGETLSELLQGAGAEPTPVMTMTAPRRRVRSINVSSSSASGISGGCWEPAPTEPGHVATPELSGGRMNHSFVVR